MNGTKVKDCTKCALAIAMEGIIGLNKKILKRHHLAYFDRMKLTDREKLLDVGNQMN